MKCPSLLSSLLASVVFLVAGAAPAFPQTSDQMQAAVPDSIEIHWKTEGFVDISNIQKGGFRSGWVDLYPEAHSEKPYVVLSPDKVSQVYAAFTFE